MRQSDVKTHHRYIARIAGHITIVTAYRTSRGWKFKDERTSLFCACSTRRLWRPVADNETIDSDTVQMPTCAEHRECWHEGRLWLPVVTWEPERTPAEAPSLPTKAASFDWIDTEGIDVAAEMYRLRKQEGRETLVAMAGC